MTRIEKVLMVVLILALVATAVFWKDVQSVFGKRKESVVEEEFKKEKKNKKEKKDKNDEKKKDNKDEACRFFVLTSDKIVA